MTAVGPPSFDALLDAVADHARRRLLRLEDGAARRRREILHDAEAHVQALEKAAEELGGVRGAAVETSVEMAAEAEIREVVAGAFDRLAERFLRRVRLALQELVDDERYPGALAAWSAQAVARMQEPAEVFAAPREVEAVYDALLAAGATDFRVLPDRRVACGFVVRDLDGRTLLDRRPDALLSEYADGLRALLQDAVPPAPGLEAKDEGDAGR